MSVAHLARTYSRSISTICPIVKNKDKIKKMDALKGASRMSTKRLPIFDNVASHMDKRKAIERPHY